MRAWTCLVLLLLVVPGWAQESAQRVALAGVEKTETREVGKFSQIELAAIGKVEATIGDEFRVQITADENVLPFVTTELVEGRLRLSLKDGLILPAKTEIRFAIQAPRIEQAVVSGAGDLSVTGDLGAKVELKLSGAGSIRAAGQVGEIAGEISGAGHLELNALAAENAAIAISGTGNAHVQTTGNLDANISGVGNVYYQGATHVQARVTGIGHVRNVAHRDGPNQASDSSTDPQ